MAGAGIVAHLPLGVYHGHAASGGADPFPSPLRLFSALVNAAFQGASADAADGCSASALEALAWLEENPPDGLMLPSTEPVGVTSGGRVAYRAVGTLEKMKAKVASKPVSDGIAVAGPIGWSWDDMPNEVKEALASLCEDVPCLGEMDSPAVLEVTGVEANWRLDPSATAFTGGGLRVPVPQPGRLALLRELYDASYPEKRPRERDDRFGAGSDAVRTFPTSSAASVTASYFAVTDREDALAATPWRDVLVMHVDEPLEVVVPEQRLGWCVAFHRALVARIGDGAPMVVTGRYPAGSSVPANRLSIQYVPRSVLALSEAGDTGGASGAFLLMLPRGIGAQDTTTIMTALAGMTRLRSRWGEMRLRVHDEVLSAHRFWRVPEADVVRTWVPTPAAVPEVTRQRGSWTFQDAILLSLGFVWRDSVGPVPKGSAGYRMLVDWARSKGAHVLTYRRLTRNASAYAHRLPGGMVAQPYNAQLALGGLLGEQELVSIGQSRHLGGGLLVPLDVPSDLASGLGV